VVLTPEDDKKSSAGRKPIDAIVLFRMLVLQALNNLSDENSRSGTGGSWPRENFSPAAHVETSQRVADHES
jgi:hypothetical protein